MSVPRMRRLAPFDPTQAGGCVLWLDGADPAGTGVPPTNGASVSTWRDKSGSGNNASGGTAPSFNASAINGIGAVSFNGSSTTLNSQDLFSNRAFSIFIIIRRQAAISSQTGILAGTQFGGNINLHFVFRNSTNLALGFYSNDLDYASFPNYTGNTSTEPAYLIEATYISGTRILYVNGNQVASDGNTTNLSSDSGALIGQYNGTYYNGFIGEIIVLNGTPAASSRRQIEGYLAQKWGLKNTLPGGHPGLTSVIYPTPRILSLTPRSYTSTFAPTTIASLALWLDASDQSTVTGSSSVTAWSDKSGVGNTMTGTASRYPTLTTNALNGQSVMTFSGGQVFTGPITLGGTSFTEFAVYYNIVATVGQAFIDDNTGPVGTLCVQNGGGNQFQVGFAYGSSFQTGGAYRIFATNCTSPSSSSTVSIWFNGTNQNIGGWNFYGRSPSAITSVTIGARKDLIYFTGTIAEIIIYNTNITAGQQQQIEGYLAWKWGLQGNLPAGHTYKSAAPAGGLTNPLNLTRNPILTNIYPTLKTGGSSRIAM